MRTVIPLLLLASFSGLSGCAFTPQQIAQYQLIDDTPLPPPVSHVESVVRWAEDSGSIDLPPQEISLALDAPLPFRDVVSILSALSGVPIVANLGDLGDSPISITYSGDFAGLLDAVSDSAGVYWHYDGRVVSFRDSRPVELVLPGILPASVIDALMVDIKSIAPDAVRLGDRVRASLSPRDAARLRGFFESQTVRIVETRIDVLQRSFSSSVSAGIDPDRIQVIIRDAIEAASAEVIASTVGGFAVDVTSPTLSLAAVVRAVRDQAGYSMSDSVTISAAAGESSRVVLGRRVPYVSEVSLSSLNEGSTTPIQTFGFAEAVDGLTLDLSQRASADSVAVSGSLDISQIVEMVTVGSGNSSISRPVIDSRTLSFSSVSRPGVPFLLLSFSSDKRRGDRDLLSMSDADSVVHYVVLARSVVSEVRFEVAGG